MLTALLASTTSALFGVADFLGGYASRTESPIAITATSHAVGVVLFALAVLAFPATYTTPAIVAGIAAGVCGGVGVAALYGALGRGRMSVVAPLTAALSGSLPALYDLLRGSRLGWNAVVGLVLALVATVIVSSTSSASDDDAPHLPGVPPSAIVLSLLAGFGFSGSFISFSFAGGDTGFWPLLAARVTSCAIFSAIALYQRGRLGVERPVRRLTYGAGVLDSAANVTMLTAIRTGPLAVASVLGSLYPVITVLLARFVLHERLKGMQRVGVGLALAAVLLTAWPR